MPLEKSTSVDQIEILENGSVQVRVVMRVFENEILVASTLHRHVIAPGDGYSDEDARVRAVCAAVHTPVVVSAYAAAQASTNNL